MNTPSRSLPDYAELRCISNFTFLVGVSTTDLSSGNFAIG